MKLTNFYLNTLTTTRNYHWSEFFDSTAHSPFYVSALATKDVSDVITHLKPLSALEHCVFRLLHIGRDHLFWIRNVNSDWNGEDG